MEVSDDTLATLYVGGSEWTTQFKIFLGNKLRLKLDAEENSQLEAVATAIENRSEAVWDAIQAGYLPRGRWDFDAKAFQSRQNPSQYIVSITPSFSQNVGSPRRFANNNFSSFYDEYSPTFPRPPIGVRVTNEGSSFCVQVDPSALRDAEEHERLLKEEALRQEAYKLFVPRLSAQLWTSLNTSVVEEEDRGRVHSKIMAESRAIFEIVDKSGIEPSTITIRAERIHRDTDNSRYTLSIVPYYWSDFLKKEAYLIPCGVSVAFNRRIPEKARVLDGSTDAGGSWGGQTGPGPTQVNNAASAASGGAGVITSTNPSLDASKVEEWDPLDPLPTDQSLAGPEGWQMVEDEPLPRPARVRNRLREVLGFGTRPKPDSDQGRP